jgi:hypothetical protein
MTKYKFSFAAAALAVSALALPCENCKSDVVFGKPAALGFGMAWSWVRLDKESKKPVAMGVTLTETALEGLAPELPQGQSMRWMEYRLEAPEGVKGLPFDHITLDWNPKGHIPPGIYDMPHFDMHFYTISEKDRKKISNVGEDIKRCEAKPADKFLMPGYILPPGTIEADMGAHWINPTSPEFNGKPFTHTFLFGTYNSRVAFIEPMVSVAFLQTKPDVTVMLPRPAAYHKAGYYPASYRINYNADRKEYSISLEGLSFSKASK